MAELPTGTVTFLFTDLEGSTRLWEEHPDAMQGALARHDEILRTAIAAHDGHVVKTTGDGAHAAFADARAAILTARDAQLALAAEGWEPIGRLRVRMGIHTGRADARDGDYYGTAVNRAARLMSAAHGGQVVVSLTTEELLRDDDAGGCTLVDLGEHRLRDLARAERVFQLRAQGLDAEFPPLRTLETFAGNLPTQLTSFVGRDEELVGVAAALRDSRFVTLTGVGGVGKTRLAIQVAAELLPAYSDGAWLCELATVTDDDGLVQVVAATLGASPRPGATLASAIVEFLRTKKLVLVIDNCEHLLDAAAHLAEQILQSCPGVKVLATSREGLAVPGEQVWPLRSLHAAQAEQLFAERARSATPTFAVDTQTASAIGEICRRLDGIPLAIELAAARAHVMTPAEIASLLDERFRLLTGGRRTAVERHQTLRAVVDWSYSSLDERDRRVFDRLGVFAGSFDSEAATAVVTDVDIEAWDVRESLTRLVERSMMDVEQTDRGSRYSMLETLRQYARERLDETDEPDRWRRRHARHYAGVAHSLGRALLGPKELDERHRFHDELDNLRAAFTWALDRDDRDDVELGVTIVAELAMQAQMDRRSGLGLWADRAFAHSAHFSAAQHHAVGSATAFTRLQGLADMDGAFEAAQSAIGRGIPPTSRAAPLAHVTLAMAHSYLDNFDEAFGVLAEGERELEDIGAEPQFVSQLIAVVSMLHGSQGQFEAARAAADRALEVARATGNPSSLALSLFALAWGTWQRDPSTALPAVEESVALTRAGAVDAGFGPALAILARVRAETGNEREAVEALRQAVAYSHDAGDTVNVGFTLYDTAALLLRHGDADLAVELVGLLRSGTLIDSVWVIGLEEDARRERLLAVCHAALSDQEFERAYARGAARSLDDTIGVVLARLDLLAEEDDRDG